MASLVPFLPFLESGHYCTWTHWSCKSNYQDNQHNGHEHNNRPKIKNKTQKSEFKKECFKEKPHIPQ